MIEPTTTSDTPEHAPRRRQGQATAIQGLVGDDPELQALAEAQRAVVDAAAFVRTLRERAGLSQRKLAERAGTTQAQVSAVERATGRQGPTIELLARLVAACGEKLALVPARIVAKLENDSKPMPVQEEDADNLRYKHAYLEHLLDEELHRPMPNRADIVRLKKEKLRIKEEIERLHHEPYKSGTIKGNA